MPELMTGAQSRPTCHLCGNFAEDQQVLYGPSGGIRTAWRVTCRTCGTYDITAMLAATLDKFAKSFSTHDRYRLSAITRRSSAQGKILELSTGVQTLLEETPQPSPVEQVDLVLEYVDQHTQPGGKPVLLDPRRDYPVAHALGEDSFRFIVNSMLKDGLVDADSIGGKVHYRITMAGYKYLEERRKAKRTSQSAGSPKVDRALEEAQRRLQEATTEEQFQAVGLLCREALISLAQAIFDPSRHGTLDGTEASATDAKRMLEAFIAAELGGKTNEEARAHAKAAVQLAVALQHDRTAKFRDAAICTEATAFVARVIAIVAGKRDR